MSEKTFRKKNLNTSSLYEEALHLVYSGLEKSSVIENICRLLESVLPADQVRWLDKVPQAEEVLSDDNGLIVVPVGTSIASPVAFWMIRRGKNAEPLSYRQKEELSVVGHFLALSLEKIDLKQKTIIDELTQVYNRAHFNRSILYEMDRSKRYHTPFSLLLLDIDKFKSFNDTYGHQTGDEVLRVVAKVMKESTRSTDMVFRYGGEEFAILLPHAEAREATQMASRLKMHVDSTVSTADRLRKAIESHPLHIQGHEIVISVSIGINTYAGTEELTPEQFIQKSDEALYHAKEMGRNRVEVMSSEERFTILIVDDETEYCNLLSNYFKSRGYAVTATTSAKIAFQLMSKNFFDLVFLDISMPEMTGLEILQKLPSHVSRKTKVVAVSAVTDPETKKACFEFGICAYVEKPISMEYLDKSLMARILEIRVENPGRDFEAWRLNEFKESISRPPVNPPPSPA